MNARALSSIARCSKAKTLEVMPCPCHDFQDQGLAVAEGLGTNRMLQKLRLTTCTVPKRFMFQDEVIASLSRVLKKENSLCRLQSLEVNVCESINLLPLVQALKTNRFLNSLTLCWDTPSIKPNGTVMTAFRQVLRDHNYTLMRVDITLRHDLGPPVDGPCRCRYTRCWWSTTGGCHGQNPFIYRSLRLLVSWSWSCWVFSNR